MQIPGRPCAFRDLISSRTIYRIDLHHGSLAVVLPYSGRRRQSQVDRYRPLLDQHLRERATAASARLDQSPHAPVLPFLLLPDLEHEQGQRRVQQRTVCADAPGLEQADKLVDRGASHGTVGCTRRSVAEQQGFEAGKATQDGVLGVEQPLDLGAEPDWSQRKRMFVKSASPAMRVPRSVTRASPVSGFILPPTVTHKDTLCAYWVTVSTASTYTVVLRVL
ncbi:hypothetical protein C8Q80DRAFT_761147 [Daedaleopsis nitida]|nr:hypothetical protein C8Q80DRAFT_761147 [Daedaleopsis nitida]